MTKLFTFLLTAVFINIGAFAGTGFPASTPGTKTYTVNDNVGKNFVNFVSEAPIETINGTADGVSGTFEFDPTRVESTAGTIEVAVRTMKTANSKRDGHMYSDVWLAADTYPSVKFVVKSLKDVKLSTKDGRNVATAIALGTFTCHGVSVPSSASITLTYLPESAETKKRSPGNLVMIEASFSVTLADHKVEGANGLIGRSVGESITVDAKVFANSK